MLVCKWIYGCLFAMYNNLITSLTVAYVFVCSDLNDLKKLLGYHILSYKLSMSLAKEDGNDVPEVVFELVLGLPVDVLVCSSKHLETLQKQNLSRNQFKLVIQTGT